MQTKPQEFWTENWKKHFEEYVHYVPFQAYYLYTLLQSGDFRILEIGGGSFHDTACLDRWGFSCTGIDFCVDVIEMAKQEYPMLQNRLFPMDAHDIEFSDKTFEVSFHNGFFANFDDHEIRYLLQEQTRVTRRSIVCSVHNALNPALMKKFKMLKKIDELYNIRFYTPDEIRKLMDPFCRKVEILPLEIPEFDQLITLTEAKDFFTEVYKNYHHAADLSRCKRLMAVGSL